MEVEVISTPMEVFRPPFEVCQTSIDGSMKFFEKKTKERERDREEERISEGQFGQITYFGAISTKLIKSVMLPQTQSNLVLFLSISSIIFYSNIKQ